MFEWLKSPPVFPIVEDSNLGLGLHISNRAPAILSRAGSAGTARAGSYSVLISLRANGDAVCAPTVRSTSGGEGQARGVGVLSLLCLGCPQHRWPACRALRAYGTWMRDGGTSHRRWSGGTRTGLGRDGPVAWHLRATDDASVMSSRRTLGRRQGRPRAWTHAMGSPGWMHTVHTEPSWNSGQSFVRATRPFAISSRAH